MRALTAAVQVFDDQRGALFPWAAVFFGLGVGVYFGLSQEPGRWFWAGWTVAVLLGSAAIVRSGLRLPLIIAVLLALAGFGAAAARTALVAGPVLGFRYYGPIDGRVVKIDRSASDKLRLTLDQVTLFRVDPDETPRRIRVSLHTSESYFDPMPGQRVILAGHLDAPGGPVEPGGFDFRRHAWFQSLGAVGYSRTPVLLFAPATSMRGTIWVHRKRMVISGAVQKALPGRTGAFAAAILTGDRSGMDRETIESLRLSNLAHLLAISGLHMGLLTGFVFAALRYALALVPRAALHLPIHKISAVGSMAAGAVYLALSGGSVATERAFIMVTVMLVAVLFDRRALTLRAVALAALIILTIHPEALAGPGFQMSFAATVALIAVFQGLRETSIWTWPPVLRWGIAVVISSAVAGLATAPFAAAHFNRVPQFGLIANVLSVPIMGGLVMPAAVLSAVLEPFGLGWVGLRVMEPGIAWILWVADLVSSWDGAVRTVVTPSSAVLPLLSLGAAFTIVWVGRMRWLGVLPVLCAFGLWALTDRPAVLISHDGGLVGVMTQSGRALSKPKGNGFAAANWLENDGDPADQADAYARAGITHGTASRSFVVGDQKLAHITGRNGAARAATACELADLVITTASIERTTGSCIMIDRKFLGRSGSMALDPGHEGLVQRTSLGANRPWNRQ